jgi:xylulose-5-phosphate/fructose-6-phosphate phosphoketolase
MIFLKDNILLKKDLSFEDVKPRLLGHWGTCPGLTLVYSHLNRLIKLHDLDMIYVVGPGHGAPSILANLWIEGSLQKYFSKYARNKDGLQSLIAQFSTPTGFPSHINAQTPGAIHEGGELGYALAVAFGAVMDNPKLIVTCIVGDGEAETGPTATAWHGFKYIDPAESGAVLPILHVNGFKISERTIFGCMDNRELVALFSGYGYSPTVVEDLDDIDVDLASALDWAVGEIRRIQDAARSGEPIVKPRWPVIILRTPKVGSRTFISLEYANIKIRVGRAPKKSRARSSKVRSHRIKCHCQTQRTMTLSYARCKNGSRHTNPTSCLLMMVTSWTISSL